MTRFHVGDLVRVSKYDVLRPGDAGIVRKILDNPTGDESLQEYIVEFGERVLDEISESGFRLRVHSDAKIHCYLSHLPRGRERTHRLIQPRRPQCLALRRRVGIFLDAINKGFRSIELNASSPESGENAEQKPARDRLV